MTTLFCSKWYNKLENLNKLHSRKISPLYQRGCFAEDYIKYLVSQREKYQENQQYLHKIGYSYLLIDYNTTI